MNNIKIMVHLYETSEILDLGKHSSLPLWIFFNINKTMRAKC